MRQVGLWYLCFPRKRDRAIRRTFPRGNQAGSLCPGAVRERGGVAEDSALEKRAERKIPGGVLAKIWGELGEAETWKLAWEEEKG